MTDRERLPRLMGADEIRQRLGYSRQWTYVITSRKDFPDPVYELGMGKIWLAEDVEKWAAAHQNVEESEGD